MLNIFLVVVLIAALGILGTALARARRLDSTLDAILGLELVLRPSRSHAALSAAKALLQYTSVFTLTAAALTLTLIALTCLLIIETARSTPKSDGNITEIAHLIRDRLPDKDLQAQRHADLVAARAPFAPVAPLASGTLRLSAAAWIVVVLSLTGALSLVLWPKSTSTISRKLAFAAVLSLGTLLSLAPVLFKAQFEGTLVGKLFSVQIDFGTVDSRAFRSEIDITVRSNGSSALECPPEWRIVGFVPGKAEALAPTSLAVEVTRVADLIKGRLAERRGVAALLLIGSVDIRPLLPDAARTFGSNPGLAQSRALHVKAMLEPKLPPPTPTVLALAAGPNATLQLQGASASSSAALMTDDRSVKVCALWSQ